MSYPYGSAECLGLHRCVDTGDHDQHTTAALVEVDALGRNCKHDHEDLKAVVGPLNLLTRAARSTFERPAWRVSQSI